MFTGIHIMIFIGFGFLMVFLKTQSWTAVGYNYLASAYVIIISILFMGFWNGAFTYFKAIVIDIYMLMNADFAAAVAMITYGAILGKVSLL
jgi:ammonium transporter Rh